LEKENDFDYQGLGYTFINAVTFQMSATKTVVDRRVYSILDWIKEVGGFTSFLQLALTFMIPYLR
jgi:hypothetical protein